MGGYNKGIFTSVILLSPSSISARVGRIVWLFRIVRGQGLILSTLHLYIRIVRGQGLILSTLHLYIRIAKGLGLILSKKSGFCIDLAESRKNSFFGHISNIFWFFIGPTSDFLFIIFFEWHSACHFFNLINFLVKFLESTHPSNLFWFQLSIDCYQQWLLFFYLLQL